MNEAIVNPERYVVAVGDGGVDHYYALSRWPDLGEQILCRPMGDYVGGMISNASSTLAGYGRHTYLIGTTTHSPEGDFILKTLGEAGVDLSHHNYDDDYTIVVCNIYLTDSGERTIFVGLDEGCTFRLTPEQQKLLNGAAFIYTTMNKIELYENGYEAIAEAREHGALVTYDLESYEDDERHQKYLGLCDIIFVNDHDFAHMAHGKEEAVYCKTLLENGAKMVVITKGGEGCSVYSKEMIVNQPACPVKPVDTTGAGDTFNSSFVYGLTQGWCLPKVTAFATAAAARCVTMVGSRSGIATLEEVEAFVKEHPLPPQR